MTEIASLSVFCGSRKGGDPAFEAAARDLADVLVRRGVRLVYGGGAIGLMGVIAGAVLAGGGEVTGVIPDFLMKYEVGNPGVTELVVVDSMHERKRSMFDLSDGIVVLPGGLGTLDETIEIITWKQLRLHTKPVVLVNVAGYWDTFQALVEQAIGSGFAHPAVTELFTVVESVDDVLDALATAPAPKEEVLTSHL